MSENRQAPLLSFPQTAKLGFVAMVPSSEHALASAVPTEVSPRPTTPFAVDSYQHSIPAFPRRLMKLDFRAWKSQNVSKRV